MVYHVAIHTPDFQPQRFQGCWIPSHQWSPMVHWFEVPANRVDPACTGMPSASFNVAHWGLGHADAPHCWHYFKVPMFFFWTLPTTPAMQQHSTTLIRKGGCIPRACLVIWWFDVAHWWSNDSILRCPFYFMLSIIHHQYSGNVLNHITLIWGESWPSENQPNGHWCTLRLI